MLRAVYFMKTILSVFRNMARKKITANYCYIELDVGKTTLNDWGKIIKKKFLLSDSLSTVCLCSTLFYFVFCYLLSFLDREMRERGKC